MPRLKLLRNYSIAGKPSHVLGGTLKSLKADENVFESVFLNWIRCKIFWYMAFISTENSLSSSPFVSGAWPSCVKDSAFTYSI